MVGTRSYGKGVFQQEIGLSNGGALKLTVGEYFTPNGVNLAGKGIHPDVYVARQPADRPRRGDAAGPRRSSAAPGPTVEPAGGSRARAEAGARGGRGAAAASELGSRGFRAALEVEAA